MRDLRAELDQFTGVYPQAWTPSEGDVLIGTVKCYGQGQNQYGPVRICTVEQEEGGLVSVWLSSTVLLSLFRQQKPKVGERIGIKYAGKHPEKGYKMYTLIVDRGDITPDFEPLGGEIPVEFDPEDPFGPDTKTQDIQPSNTFQEKIRQRAGGRP